MRLLGNHNNIASTSKPWFLYSKTMGGVLRDQDVPPPPHDGAALLGFGLAATTGEHSGASHGIGQSEFVSLGSELRIHFYS